MKDKIKQKLIWFLKEMVKTLSSMKSFFSAKRIERSMAFNGGYWFILTYGLYHIATLTVFEAIAISSLLFTVSGYILDKTEKAKKTDGEQN